MFTRFTGLLAMLAVGFLAAPVNAHEVKRVNNGTVAFSGVDATDKVQLIRENGTPGTVTICIAASQNVTWWKTLEVWAGPNRKLSGMVEVKDNNKGPNCLSYDTNEFAPKYARIEMKKAKAFNAPSGAVFKRFSPWAYDGKKFTVRWIGD